MPPAAQTTTTTTTPKDSLANLLLRVDPPLSPASIRTVIAELEKAGLSESTLTALIRKDPDLLLMTQMQYEADIDQAVATAALAP